MKDALQDKLRSQSLAHGRCFVGFDGFIDHLLTVVGKREDPDHYQPLPSIAALSQRLADAAGKSTNLEWVRKGTKIGGNGPILAAALCAAGQEVHLAGTFGNQAIFDPLRSRCATTFDLGPPGQSHCLEFEDGKIILGEVQGVATLDADLLQRRIGFETIVQQLRAAQLVATVNWTMIYGMNNIWRALINQVCPQLDKKGKYFFVDLADPAKRSDAHLREALDLLRTLTQHFHVILGLNQREAERVGRVLGVEGWDLPRLRNALGIQEVLFHTSKIAMGVNSEQEGEAPTFFTPAPKVSTGAGDNFNGGYLSGLLWGLPLEERLHLATATAGYYVRKGESPDRSQLADFLARH